MKKFSLLREIKQQPGIASSLQTLCVCVPRKGGWAAERVLVCTAAQLYFLRCCCGSAFSHAAIAAASAGL